MVAKSLPETSSFTRAYFGIMPMLMIILAAMLSLQGGAQAQAQSGLIMGRVFLVGGDPAVNIRVAVADVHDKTGTTFVRLTRTDTAGQYRLDEIPPGEYRIIAGLLTAPTYYPGRADVASAIPVRITGGTILDGFDFEIAPASLTPLAPLRGRRTLQADVTIHGQVLVEGGSIAPISSLELEYTSSMMPILSRWNLSLATDGTFSLTLVPDEYYVSVSASSGSVAGDYYVKSLRSGHIDLLQSPLHVSSAQADLEVILVRGNNIAGNVRTEKGSPANVSVYLIPTITPSTRQDLARRSSTDAQGNFVLRGVAPGSYYLSSQNNSDRNRLTVPINVGEEATPFMNLILGPDRSLIRSSQ